MNDIFADTQGWLALTHKRDHFNRQAVNFNKKFLEQGRTYITTNFVLDEAYTLLLARMSHKNAVDFGEMVRISKAIKIIHISEALEEEAWQLFKKYSDKNFSFTDCTSFVVMKKLSLNEAFTNDHHFEQMGFSVILK